MKILLMANKQAVAASAKKGKFSLLMYIKNYYYSNDDESER